MIHDFLVVLMTNHISDQVRFYHEVLGLELIFDNQDTAGLGKNDKLYIVLREDKSKNSHYLTDQKGPQIITFKCQGDINQYIDKISGLGFKIRDTLALFEHNSHYLFIEDADGNEICLDFKIR